jgi:hypothetical protein
MKRGIRDTIRRKPDYERDPDWDISDIIAAQKRNSRKSSPLRHGRDAETDGEERSYPDEER